MKIRVTSSLGVSPAEQSLSVRPDNSEPNHHCAKQVKAFRQKLVAWQSPGTPLYWTLKPETQVRTLVAGPNFEILRELIGLL